MKQTLSNKFFKRLLIGLMFYLSPIFLMFMLIGGALSQSSSHDACDITNSQTINAGGHLFSNDYVVLQPWGNTPWSQAACTALYSKAGCRHTGIDVQAVGDEDGSKNMPVLSVKPGIVHGVGADAIGGNWVVVKHTDTEYAYYGHLKDNTIKVKAGDKVVQGTVLAVMGNTGATTIYHVHFEIRTTPEYLSDIDPSKIFGKDHVNQGDYFSVKSDGKAVVTNVSNTSNSAVCGSSSSFKGNNNMEKMWYFFKEKGYTDEAVAGIIGSAMAESSEALDPKMQQVGGPARGIFQWESQNTAINGGYTGQADSRFDKLYKWAKDNKKDPFIIDTQLEYAYLEMTDPTYDSTTYSLLNEPEFKKIKSIAEATTKFTRSFERAGIEAMGKRLSYAQSVYETMKGKK